MIGWGWILCSWKPPRFSLGSSRSLWVNWQKKGALQSQDERDKVLGWYFTSNIQNQASECQPINKIWVTESFNLKSPRAIFPYFDITWEQSPRADISKTTPDPNGQTINSGCGKTINPLHFTSGRPMHSASEQNAVSESQPWGLQKLS